MLNLDKSEPTMKFSRFISHTGILFNVIFLLYVFSFEKPFTREMYEIFENGKINVPLGLFWLSLFVLESFAFVIRLGVIADKAISGETDSKKTVSSLLVWGYVCRLLVTGTITLAYTNALGLSDKNFLGVLFVLYVFLRELIALLALFVLNIKSGHKITLGRITHLTFVQRGVDTVLFLFGMFTFSAYWGAIVIKNDFLGGGLSVVNIIGSMFFSTIAYIGVRFIYLVEESYFAKSKYERFSIVITTFLVIFVTAITALT